MAKDSVLKFTQNLLKRAIQWPRLRCMWSETVSCTQKPFGTSNAIFWGGTLQSCSNAFLHSPISLLLYTSATQLYMGKNSLNCKAELQGTLCLSFWKWKNYLAVIFILHLWYHHKAIKVGKVKFSLSNVPNWKSAFWNHWRVYI